MDFNPGTLKKPFFCDLIITETCMLRCKMCRMWQSKNDAGDISTAVWKDFIASLADFTAGSPAQIQFVGGEPLSKKDIFELIHFSRQKGFSTTMTTNGYLIDEKIAREIVGSGLDTVVLSIDGAKEETHDFLRGGKGVFARVMRSIDSLAGIKKDLPKIHVVTTIMRPNIDELVGLADWAQRDNRLERITFQALVQPFFTCPDDEWYKKEEFSFLWPDNPQKLNAVLDKLADYKIRGHKITNHPSQLSLFKSYFAHPEIFVRSSRCNLGYNSVSVNTSGKVFLCFAMHPIGDIRDGKKFEDIWFSDSAAAARDRIKECKNNCKSMINCFFEPER